MFGTLQERLPKELKLAGIADMAITNRFLKEAFLPAFNRRFRIQYRYYKTPALRLHNH